ncbi:tetratricopeptide repeat protein [Xinfangfangia sp. CPCC 101601]|uniref:Tetratricopeptide repeat protein n=1 Tax=Pseudogemmobacter lacusdianii TaxID=3069608 RepID=A0ABU0VX47_9RHOB|nr:tetratricopeptide repeat protein [Xinfangfangia sp. CPCC 101601]MDQ2066303.1 tetratricopeptide repeat protein [Xinfangfangia sp. CPCC 101601]
MSSSSRPALAAALTAVLALALPSAGSAEAEPTTADREITAETVVVPAAQGLAGAYLAARVAEAETDFREAAYWYDVALQLDPGNLALIEGGLYAVLALGEFERAGPLADALAAGPMEDVQLAAFVQDALQIGAEDWAGLLQAKADGRQVGPVLDELIVGWSRFGDGKVSEALKDFDALASKRGLEAIGLYHKALALAVAGDFEGADAILSGSAQGKLNLNRRGVIARVQILSQLERNEDALALLAQAFGTEPEPMLDALRASLQTGETLPFDVVTGAKSGLAEAFFTIAALLRSDADPSYVLIHSRIANFLDPTNADALLMTAQSLEELGQYNLAVETYAQISPDQPVFYSAEIGRADALYAAGDKEAAVAALQGLTESHSDLVVVHSSYADILRREDRCADAVAAYDAALALVDDVQPMHWSLFFSRGVCHEQLKDWPKTEADFRRALELRPGQPQVLNYLGYSMVDRGINLEEALSLIEKAVKAEPESGYIIDSLAWAYFRLGRYDEALKPMEKASLLEPSDPVVTDHLGDVYWMVGRKREAEFQWHRALSFSPTEKDAERIRKKLEIGLDQVMAAEASAPVEAQPEAATTHGG